MRAKLTIQKVTGKLLDLSLAPGGEGMGGEGAEAWMGGGGEKIFLLNKFVTGIMLPKREADQIATSSPVLLVSHQMPTR